MFNLVEGQRVECIASWNKPLAMSCDRPCFFTAVQISWTSGTPMFHHLHLDSKADMANRALVSASHLWALRGTHYIYIVPFCSVFLHAFKYIKWFKITKLSFSHTHTRTHTQKQTNSSFWSTEVFAFWHPVTRGPWDKLALKFVFRWIKEADLLEPFHFTFYSSLNVKQSISSHLRRTFTL